MICWGTRWTRKVIILMSDGSAIKISKGSIPARLGERGKERRAREREHAVPPSCSPTAQFCVLFRRQDERQERDNAHPSDPRFLELRLLRAESGYLRIRHRGREHTAHLELSKSWGSWSPCCTCASCMSSLSRGEKCTIPPLLRTETPSWTDTHTLLDAGCWSVSVKRLSSGAVGH